MKILAKIPKSGRKVLVVVLVLALLAGTILGVLFILRGRSGGVNVYPVMDLATDYRWAQEAETEGRVTTDKIQSVYVSATQQVTEVYVKEGDTVQAGDPLMAFDTTLTDLELERQQITVQKLELALENAWKNLETVNNYRVYVPPVYTEEPEDEEPELTPVALPYRIPGKGVGTADNPWYFLWNDNCSFDAVFVNSYLPALEEGGDSYPTFSGVFEIRENDSPQGDVLRSWMMHFTRTADGGYAFTISEPTAPISPEDFASGELLPSYGGGGGTVSSLNELISLRMEAQKKITDTDLELKQARHKLEMLQYELTNGIVYAEIDGVIKSLRDPEEAMAENKPVLLLSGGGGYYVTGTLSELELTDVQVGDTVTVMSWESYEQVEATITEISEYPATGGYYYHYSNGNQNVSLYPFTVFLDEDAPVREGEYVYITYYPGGDTSNSLYLENPFILLENGKSYVYVADADGRLAKRQIGTGRSLWGSYTEIIGGLSPEEFIAFPYGRNLREGAKVNFATLDQLYAVYG